MARPIYEAKEYSWKFELKAKVAYSKLIISMLENKGHCQMQEAAASGIVPDVGPPNTKEQEAALRPMCAQLKVRVCVCVGGGWGGGGATLFVTMVTQNDIFL